MALASIPSINVPGTSILEVVGSTVSKIAGGLLRVEPAEDGSRLRLTVSQDFEYVLAGQPMLRSSPLTYVLPYGVDRQYVISFPTTVSATLLQLFDDAAAKASELRRGLSDPSAAARSRLTTSQSLVVAQPVQLAGVGPALGLSADALPESSTAATVGSYVATGVVFAGKALSKGLVVGADYGGQGVKWASVKLKEYWTPAPAAAADGAAASGAGLSTDTPAGAADANASRVNPRAPANGASTPAAASAPPAAIVSVPGSGSALLASEGSSAADAGANSDAEAAGYERWRTALTYAKWASGTAAAGSKALAVGVAAAASSLGGSIVAAVSQTEYGKSLGERGDSEAGRAVRTVAVATIHAYREVIDGLERAAVVFSEHAAPATKDLVSHRYGPEAAELSAQGLSVAADLGTTAWNIRNASVMGIAKSTAVQTVQTVAKEGIIGAGGDRSPAARGVAAGGGNSRAASPALSTSSTAATAVSVGGHGSAGVLASSHATTTTCAPASRSPVVRGTAQPSQPAASSGSHDAALAALLADMPSVPAEPPRADGAGLRAL